MNETRQQRLLEAFQDNTLSEAECRELLEWFDEDESHLAEFADELRIGNALANLHLSDSDAIPTSVYDCLSQTVLADDVSQEVRQELVRKQSKAAFSSIALGAVAVATMAIVVLSVFSSLPFSGDSQPGPLPNLGGTLANFDALEFPDGGIWSAARNGDNAQIERILKNSVEVDSRLGRKELAPLHVAALYGHADTVELLLDKEATVMNIDAHGNTALHMAAFFGHEPIAKLLLARGAKVNETNAMGHTPLDLVSDEWSPQLAARYEQLGDDMKQELDLGRIRLARSSLVKLLQEHVRQEQDEVAQTHRKQKLHLLTKLVCLRKEPSC